MIFFSTAQCRGHAYCATCRTSAPFRATLLAKGLVTLRDFACPVGITAETALLLSTATRGKVVLRKKGCGPCLPVVTGG